MKEKKIDTENNKMKAAELKNITIKGRCIDLFKYLANEQPDTGHSDEPQIIQTVNNRKFIRIKLKKFSREVML